METVITIVVLLVGVYIVIKKTKPEWISETLKFINSLTKD